MFDALFRHCPVAPENLLPNTSLRPLKVRHMRVLHQVTHPQHLTTALPQLAVCDVPPLQVFHLIDRCH